MSEILNPYIAGAPVVETSMFFGREDIFSWIERSLTGKFVNHILVLHGQRRVGKTSVLKQIPNNLPKRYIQVFFDLQGRTNTTLDRFLWWMASEIVRTVKKEADLELPKPDRNAFSDPEAFINDFLPPLRSALGERVLLLTFDEFDTLDRPDIQDSLARPLIAYLRRLIDLDGLNFIFSIGSSGNKLENMQASYTDFFKAALYRKVSFLTTDDCISLITKPVEGLISYDPKAVDKITHYTSGHPYFTQLMCHELFSRCQKTGARQIKPADVDEILPDVIERGTVNLKFVWDEASDLEKWTLAALAQEEGMALRAISQVLKGQSVRFSETDLNSGVLHLRDKDVLSDDNHFVIHLLKLWLLANRPMDRVREELVQTNPIADRYNEIGDEYRERGEIEQAIQSYQQALQAQSNNSRALVSIAAIHAGRNDHQKAAETYEQVLKLDDENIAARQGFSQAQMALAQAALDQGMDDTAIRAYKAILQRNPVHNEARQQMVQIYQKQAETLLASGAHDQAEKKLREALECLPGDELLSASLEKVAAEKKSAQVRGWVQKADKAMTRQRYDEAAGMIEEAIVVDPDNQDLQKRLLEIRDSPRQERVKAYRHEAEQAIAKGNYPKAISAIETAILLAPEDKELSHWLNEMRSDQSNAQLHLHQSQAAQLQATGDWDGAVAAWEAALKLKPNDEGLRAELIAAQNSREEAQVKALRAKVDSTRKAGRWEEALAAMQQLLVLIPQDTTLAGELENIQAEYHQAKVRDLKKEAESAVRQEKWEDAQKAWQAYLAEVPEEAGQVEKHIARARKNAALLNDYETAQGLIRKRQYGKAIHLLQGIIAQDATYKASSRLLVEAVEANKQRKPFLKKPWVSIGGAVIVLGILSIVFLPKIKTGLAALKVEKTQEAPTEALVLQNTTPEASTTEALMLDNTATEFTLTPDPTPENAPVVPALALAVTDYISTTPPTFEDDFSTEKREWGDLGTLVIESSQLQLTFKEMNDSEIVKYPKNGFLDTSQFVISYDFTIIDNGDVSMNRIFGFEFLSVQDGEYFELVFNGKGDWKISQSNKGYSILAEGNFNVHQSQNVILSVFGDNLIALLNNEVVALIEGFEKIGTSNLFIASTNEPDDFTVSYDNIQFWDLEGVELEVAQVQPTATETATVTPYPTQTPMSQPAWVTEFGDPILDYISDRTPKYVDEFESISKIWNSTNCDEKSRWVADGEVYLDNCEIQADYLYVHDFVAEVNVHISRGWGSVGLRNNPCIIDLYHGDSLDFTYWILDAGCDGSNLGGSGNIPYKSTMNFLIIVKNQDFAYYINQKPMGFADNAFVQGSYPRINLYSHSIRGGIGVFSDFKLWDISDLNIP